MGFHCLLRKEFSSLPYNAINPVSWALKILCSSYLHYSCSGQPSPTPRLATQPMCISSRPKPWISSVRRSHFPFPPLHLHVTCYSPFFPSLNIDGLEVDSAQEGVSQTLPSRDLGSARGTTSRVALGEGIRSAWEPQSFMEQVGGSFDR